MNIDNVDVIFGTQAIAHVGELLAQAFEDDERHIDTAEGDLPAATTLPLASRAAIPRVGAHHDRLQ